jgi:hypothetical protein
MVIRGRDAIRWLVLAAPIVLLVLALVALMLAAIVLPDRRQQRARRNGELLAGLVRDLVNSGESPRSLLHERPSDSAVGSGGRGSQQ